MAEKEMVVSRSWVAALCTRRCAPGPTDPSARQPSCVNLPSCGPTLGRSTCSTPSPRLARHSQPLPGGRRARACALPREEEPERSWRRQRALTAATRRRLVLDVLTGVLSFEIARMAMTRIVLLRAVQAERSLDRIHVYGRS